MRQRSLLLVWLLAALPAAAQLVPGRFVVELDGEPAAAVAPRGSVAFAARRAELEAHHRGLAPRLTAHGARVLARLDTVTNGLIVQAPNGAAASLAALPGVARVLPVYRMKLALDRVAVLHYLADAWNRLPASPGAGAGVKIGIIDTGADPEHPGFQDTALAVPAGYPKPAALPREFAGRNKFIVARSYEDLTALPRFVGPRDADGHGTGVAMAAAGVPVLAPLAYISGAAPKAWLGIYRVVDDNGGLTSDTVLKAIDDAVADGMDILNLSLGSPLPLRPQFDPYRNALRRAGEAGVMVVAAAGNEGPLPNSIGSPGSVENVISVGAISSDRMFATAVRVEGQPRMVSMPPSGPWPQSPISAPLRDATEVDATGLLCDEAPAKSLEGHIVLILRGNCDFSVKLARAEAAGAVGAVVYTDAGHPTLMRMSVAGAKLPAQSVGYADGMALKALLKTTPDPKATLDPGPEWIPLDSTQVASFSSGGPNASDAIKPDLVAVGENLYTAAQSMNADGESYDPSGYTTTQGTSFSSPIVAGALAVVKGARPGLKPDEYRSLLVNSATPLLASGKAAVQRTGAGTLNLEAALRASLAVVPATLSFGVAGATASFPRMLAVRNLGTSADTVAISVEPNPGTVAPEVGAASVTLAAGETMSLPVSLKLPASASGEQQGFIVLRGAPSGAMARVPYWCGVRSNEPKYIRVAYSEKSGPLSAHLDMAAVFQVLDASGIGLPFTEPRVTVVSGGGTVDYVETVDELVPGGFAVGVHLSRAEGDNVFRIEAGAASATFTVRSKP